MRGGVGSCFSQGRQAAAFPSLPLEPGPRGLVGWGGGSPQNATLGDDGFWTGGCPGSFLSPHLLGEGQGDGKQMGPGELTCGIDNTVQQRP